MPDNDANFMDDLPVSEHLEDFNLPTISEEIAQWAARCHETYLLARDAQDLRSMVTSLTAGFRGLETKIRTLESQQIASQAALPQAQIDAAIQAHDDEIVAKVIEAARPLGGWVSCPSGVCRNGFCPRSIADVVASYLGRNRNQEVNANGNDNVTGD